MEEADKRFLYVIIPLYLATLAMVFALVFLYNKVYNQDNTDGGSAYTSGKILLSLKDISFSAFLQKSPTDTELLKFYEEPSEEPYLDIYFTYNTYPTGMTFKILDKNGTVVGDTRSVAFEKDGYSQWRYPFDNNGSDYYTIQYSLPNDSYNTNNVAIIKIEMTNE